MFPSPSAAGRRSLGALVVALALALRVTAQDPPAPIVAPIPVGMNLRALTPYDREWVFADAMKIASEWRYEDTHQVPRTSPRRGGTKPPPPDSVVPLDANGWPRPGLNRSVACDFFTTMRGRMPVGEYTITWKGKGTLEFRGHVGIVSQGDHRIVARVDGVAGGQPGVALTDVDPTDPIRDIHVWLPGLEESCHSFHPIFLERLKPFQVLRFYPWMRVYSSTGRWQNRSTMQSARLVNTEGVPIEYMVDLCNELQSDPWFCIPHTADDDYVRRFATLVRDSLRHAGKVYVEFSNETWNTDFAVGQWAREQARQRGIAAMQVVGERAAQVFDIWQDVFGKEKARVVRVAGVQLHNPGIANTLCKALNGKFDAMAVGAYFGCRADRDPVNRDSTADELMTVARANLQSQVLQRITDHRTLADSFSSDLGRHIALLTYEGGQSIVARSPGGGLNIDATMECQRMPAMFDAYRTLIEGAQARGVELFIGYDFVGSRGAFDTFSVLEYLEEPLDNAVKYKALIQGWETRGQ